MDYQELYDLIDEITDQLVVLKGKVEDDYIYREIGKVESQMDDIRSWLEDDEKEDPEAWSRTERDLNAWLDAQQRVS